MNKIATIVEVTSSDAFRRMASVIEQEIREVYLENDAPWVVCFSGGKDSTALLQLLFHALSRLPKEKITKELHVISNDTLVENPFIVKHIANQVQRIKECGKTQLYSHKPELFCVEIVRPQILDSFWVNLIGKGYPSPNRWFRWCTERLKIKPTSDYIQNTLKRHRQVIIVLGTRKAESGNRAASMKNYNGDGRLRRHTLPNALAGC